MLAPFCLHIHRMSLKSTNEHEDENHPMVKIDFLKESVLKEVINTPHQDNRTKFDLKVQLRGFLRTVEVTPACKAEFTILDDATKQQKPSKNGVRFLDINANVSTVITALSSPPSLLVRIRD